VQQISYGQEIEAEHLQIDRSSIASALANYTEKGAWWKYASWR